jgi:sugar phosphate isomerase/epimerase
METLYIYDMSSSKLQLKVLATNWGFEGTLRDYITKVKQEGYDGIEIWWPMEERELTELVGLLNENDLEAGFLCGAQDINYTEQYNFYKKIVEAEASNRLIKQLYINFHS